MTPYISRCPFCQDALDGEQAGVYVSHAVRKEQRAAAMAQREAAKAGGVAPMAGVNNESDDDDGDYVPDSEATPELDNSDASSDSSGMSDLSYDSEAGEGPFADSDTEEQPQAQGQAQ